MKIYCYVLLLFSLTATAKVEHMTSIQNSQHHALHSAVLDHEYHIFVLAPSTTEQNKDQLLPVVYLLDGGNTYPMFAAYARYLAWVEDVPEMILVGISYGTDDWRKGNRRSTDFTLPAEGRDHYGGAALFHRFLTDELMPMIESTYPADPKNRILFGHSLAGQFALYNAQFKPNTFRGIIASNPAIHNNTSAFTKPVQDSKAQPELVIVQADNDDERYRQARQKWLEYWQHNPHHWKQHVVTVKDHNHMSSVPAAFRQGMMRLFPKQAKQTE